MGDKLVRLSDVIAFVNDERNRYDLEYEPHLEIFKQKIDSIPAVDAVDRAVYEQVAWERDTALAQLSDIGKGLGEKMDDVSKVVRCRECIHRPSVSDHDEIGGFKYEFPDERCPCNCEDRWYSWMPDDNWFCGNGQRREDGDGDG